VFAIATGIPVIVLAWLLAYTIAGVGKLYNGLRLFEKWFRRVVAGNSVFSNFFASIVGAFMYFAILTEVPILQGLMGAGMGKGPALALLRAGPSLSLPKMLVIRGVIGTKKTLVYVVLVVIMPTRPARPFWAR
jgi:uncharacterized membrane protein YraQ (UPF0718 family)